MDNKNIWLIPIKEEPIKGDLLLRHIWKGTEHECRSLWQYNETITIDDVKQYTTLNGSFRDYYKCFKPQYLYVTSKEPYQTGDWVKNITIELEPPFKLDAHGIRYTQISPCKFEKVVLTTDRYLIADGVQVVPDEFLEWFVKNPSCEWVEVEKDRVFRLDEFRQREFYNNYKIIIPQEEVRQELEKEMFELEQELDIPSNLRWHNSKPKQELERGITITHVGKQQTLEEVAERWNEKQTTLEFGKPHNAPNRIKSFIAGAKSDGARDYWFKQFQQEQDKNKYSEEEVFQLTLDALDLGMKIRQNQLNGHSDKSGKELHSEWFEQLKKKQDVSKPI